MMPWQMLWFQAQDEIAGAFVEKLYAEDGGKGWDLQAFLAEPKSLISLLEECFAFIAVYKFFRQNRKCLFFRRLIGVYCLLSNSHLYSNIWCQQHHAFDFHGSLLIFTKEKLTVVLIHMRAATLAPMATAPAVPPRMADFADLFMISEKVGAGFLLSSLLLMVVEILVVW